MGTLEMMAAKLAAKNIYRWAVKMGSCAAAFSRPLPASTNIYTVFQKK